MILEEIVRYKAVGKRKLMKRRQWDVSMHTHKKKKKKLRGSVQRKYQCENYKIKKKPTNLMKNE